jgi:hypothetical protein
MKNPASFSDRATDGSEPADWRRVLILNAIDEKRNKGRSAYASGKTLVVFVNASTGEWFPNGVARPALLRDRVGGQPEKYRR